MSSVSNSIVILLVLFTIYRPFITRLDIMKYIMIGGLTLLLPIISQHKKVSSPLSNNATYTHTIYVTEDWKDQADVNDAYLLTDTITFVMLSTSIISLCGLLSRWQFPINFVKPTSNPYLSSFLRHGISLFFIYLAIRYTLY